jgi:hypothetical protein
VELLTSCSSAGKAGFVIACCAVVIATASMTADAALTIHQLVPAIGNHACSVCLEHQTVWTEPHKDRTLFNPLSFQQPKLLPCYTE